jgi:hypothetical protein
MLVTCVFYFVYSSIVDSRAVYVQERAEFEARLRARDGAERAKRRGGGHIEEDHEALDKGLDDDRKLELINTLREMSEQVYLEKRSEKKLKVRASLLMCAG